MKIMHKYGLSDASRLHLLRGDFHEIQYYLIRNFWDLQTDQTIISTRATLSFLAFDLDECS